MNDLLLQRGVVRAIPASDNSCRGCPQANRGGFCGAHMHPKCLRIDREGRVRVSLSASPQAWFETLSQFGEVFHQTRNPVGILGRLGNLPTLGHSQESPLPSDATGGYRPNLAEYASVWAIRENSPVGALYGLEVCDASGTGFERILLPTGADHARFTQFVIDHQSPPEEAGSWFPPNHTASAQRRAGLASRIPRLRAQWMKGDRFIRRLPVRFVPKLLAEAARLKMQLRITSFHPALIRTVTWMPETCAETSRADGDLEFFYGDNVGLHLGHQAAASVWLWRGWCSCCGEQQWRIEIGDVRDQVGLAIKAADESSEAEWRSLLWSCRP